MISLQNTPASTASLLLNFEGVGTTLIALLFFKEAISRRAWTAIIIITLASIFHPKYWNHGYATEAAHTIVDFGFNHFGVHRIWADH